ncbi:MAG: helix-turn-helix domain-containing protein [Actinomycetota bacterium]|jgi:excisionase family DNA binding protein|nr:helix-turn-helix domain-containing protein [Actinomycetota bacterium]
MARRTTTAASAELDALLNLDAASGVLGISTRTLKTMISRGDLPSVKLGGRRMVRRSVLAQFIAALEP